MRPILIFVILSLTDLTTALAGHNVGVRLFGLSIHPKGEATNAHLMPLRLDKDAYLVQDLGLVLSYERGLVADDVFTVKAALAAYADCAQQLGGFMHIGLRGRILHIGRHQLYGGIGPTLIFRENWLRLDGYVDQHLFKGGREDAFQYLFLWYGGEFEYRYQLSPRIDAAVNFVPGYPDLINLSIGFNYKL